MSDRESALGLTVDVRQFVPVGMGLSGGAGGQEGAVGSGKELNGGGQTLHGHLESSVQQDHSLTLS